MKKKKKIHILRKFSVCAESALQEKSMKEARGEDEKETKAKLLNNKTSFFLGIFVVYLNTRTVFSTRLAKREVEPILA